MDDGVGLIAEAGRDLLWTVLKVAAPILLTAMVTGLLTGVFQALTQIQDPTLAFVPKLIGVLFVILALAPWLAAVLCGYTERVFAAMPTWFP